MAKRVETMSIKGKAYAKVKDRSKAYHQDKKFDGRGVQFLDQHCPHGITIKCILTKGDETYEGSSFVLYDALSQYDNQKVYEKNQTIAYGRALAFAGYLADGEIATAEEIEDMVTQESMSTRKREHAKWNIMEQLEQLDLPPEENAIYLAIAENGTLEACRNSYRELRELVEAKGGVQSKTKEARKIKEKIDTEEIIEKESKMNQA